MKVCSKQLAWKIYLYIWLIYPLKREDDYGQKETNLLSHCSLSFHRREYNVNGVDIGKSNSKKDLGLLVSQNLRPREQCISARNRANRVLDFITRSVSNRSVDVILRLYLALVRLHLDYAV